MAFIYNFAKKGSGGSIRRFASNNWRDLLLRPHAALANQHLL